MPVSSSFAIFSKSYEEILNNSNLTFSESLIEIFNIYSDYINSHLIDQKQIFPSFISKIIYLSKKFNIEESYIKYNISLIKQIKQIIKINLKIDSNIFNLYIGIINTYINLLENNSNNNDLRVSESELLYFPTSEIDNLFNLQVIAKHKKDNYICFVCLTLNSTQINILINNHLSYLEQLIWKDALINIINFQRLDENTYINNDKSFLVLHPNYLLDITELAECFNSNKFNYLLYFAKKFELSNPNIKAVLGNLVNYCFDELIYNNSINYEELFSSFIKVRPLVIFNIFYNNKSDFELLKKEGLVIFEKLKNNLKKLNLDKYHIEPTFLSAKYGIQGRLDLLLESLENPNEKNIIELKSGKVPNINMGIAYEDKFSFNTGMWINHYVQIIGYILLLESTYNERTGYSSIFYASESDTPLRNAPDNLLIKQELLKLRNIIISAENSILNNNFKLFDSITTESFNNLPSFITEKVSAFQLIYSNLNSLEIHYFQRFYKFILNENYHSKVGNGRNNGFAELWLSNTDLINPNSQRINNLQINLSNTDFNNLHIFFNINDDSFRMSSLRQGDPCIIFKDAETSSALNDKILKGTIKSLNDHHIVVSLRNKQTDLKVFSNDSKWNIVPDLMDTSSKYAYKSLVKLFNSDNIKKNIILGLLEPRSYSKTETDVFDTKYFDENIKFLDEYQKLAVQRAIKSKDYFLIQGPPGTGKTSYVISSIAKYFNDKTNNNVLLLAYTNRAVDGLCKTLISLNIDFIRIGSKETTEYPDYSFFNLAEKLELKDLYKKLMSVRFIVSTITSFQTNPEIANIKKFQLGIIDEASQILEPHLIGILSEIDKFILVGDEKQLPAVVIQEVTDASNIEEFNQICLSDLSESYFARMLKVCKKNNWSDSYISLVYQSRMHIDIQDIANIMFYGGILKSHQNNLNQYNRLPALKFENKLLQDIFMNRVIFINTPKDNNLKTNSYEAKLIIKLIEEIKKSNILNNQSIGIISPFKAQCSLIRNSLDDYYHNIIDIDTIERFQGSERNTIFISLSVNSYSYLNKIISQTIIDNEIIDRKLNVSITRAKDYCIILGNKELLTANKVYLKLLEYINNQHFEINFEEIKKVLDFN